MIFDPFTHQWPSKTTIFFGFSLELSWPLIFEKECIHFFARTFPYNGILTMGLPLFVWQTYDYLYENRYSRFLLVNKITGFVYSGISCPRTITFISSRLSEKLKKLIILQRKDLALCRVLINNTEFVRVACEKFPNNLISYLPHSQYIFWLWYNLQFYSSMIMNLVKL